MSLPATDPVVGHQPIRISSKQKPEDVELVTLVIVDDVEYKIPARPRANLALVQLGLVRRWGPEIANAALLEVLLGEDAFNALAACEAMTDDQLESIATAAMRLTMGPLEVISKN